MSVSLNVDGGTGAVGYYDTLAQSFFVDTPIHVTKIDLYFSSKDSISPVEVTLRRIENNVPSSNVIPNSIVTKAVSNITTSTDGTAATTFTFSAPVSLEVGQYCFTLSSVSARNRVYVSQIGGIDLVNNSVISKQPYAGVLFLSSNGTTWTADQTKDVKFKVYRAKLTSKSATVDLMIDTKNLVSPTLTKLNADPFKSYNSSAVVKVFHNNHGFESGNYVKFNGLPNYISYLSNTSSSITVNNGIPVEKLDNVYFTVGNVTSDSYTVVLSTTAGETANITAGRFGGRSVLATTIVPYTTVFPNLSAYTPSKSSITHKLKTIDDSYTVSDFTAVTPTDVTFKDAARLLLDTKNSTESAGGADSFVYRLELSSTDDYSSPIVNIPQSSVLFVTPDINSPSVSDNLSLDTITISSADTGISFTSTGVINISGANAKANAKVMVPGANVVITGAHANNNSDSRIISVAVDGSSITVNNPYAITEAAGNVVSMTYKPMFVAEQATTGSSSKSKYVTRKIELANPASALLVRFTVSKPTNTNIEVYYKTQNGNEASSFDTKEYTYLDIGTVKDTVDGQFIDIEKFIEDLTPFNAFTIKIVFKSSSIAYYPKVKDLRIIALS